MHPRAASCMKSRSRHLYPVFLHRYLLPVKKQNKIISFRKLAAFFPLQAVHIRIQILPVEKIELNPKEPEYLKVVWGVGYKMEKQELAFNPGCQFLGIVGFGHIIVRSHG